MEEPTGETRVHPDVFEQIARETAQQVPGVAEIMEEGGWWDRVIPRGYRGGRTTEAEEGEPPAGRTFNLSVQMEEGAVIPQVARRIQESVKEAVERMTDETVAAVNIHVNRIQKPSDPKAPSAPQRRVPRERESEEA